MGDEQHRRGRAATGSSSQRQLNFPNSLGLLYSAFTYFCGFRVNSGEYKLMGLAPYGEPRYADRILDHLIDLRRRRLVPDGHEVLRLPAGLTMTNRRFDDLFDGPAARARSRRSRSARWTSRASIQVVTEEIVLQHGARTRPRPPASATRAWPAASR